MANGLRSEVERFSRSHHLDPDMVMAIIQVESAERRSAFRPETSYGYLWDNRLKQPFRRMTEAEMASELPPLDFTDLRGLTGRSAAHEWWGQQTSWGYMQVMGAVAREFGFQEIYLTQLLETGYNLEYGCSLLQYHSKWANGDRDAVLAAYNGGRKGNAPGQIPKRNQGYVNRVLEEMGKIRMRGVPV